MIHCNAANNKELRRSVAALEEGVGGGRSKDLLAQQIIVQHIDLEMRGKRAHSKFDCCMKQSRCSLLRSHEGEFQHPKGKNDVSRTLPVSCFLDQLLPDKRT